MKILQKRKRNNITCISNNNNNTITGTKIEEIVSTSGTVSVFPATSLAENEFILMNLNEARIKQLYPIKEEIGAKTELADNYFLHGEYAHQITKLPFQVHVKNVKIS